MMKSLYSTSVRQKLQFQGILNVKEKRNRHSRIATPSDPVITFKFTDPHFQPCNYIRDTGSRTWAYTPVRFQASRSGNLSRHCSQIRSTSLSSESTSAQNQISSSSVLVVASIPETAELRIFEVHCGFFVSLNEEQGDFEMTTRGRQLEAVFCNSGCNK